MVLDILSFGFLIVLKGISKLKGYLFESELHHLIEKICKRIVLIFAFVKKIC